MAQDTHTTQTTRAVRNPVAPPTVRKEPANETRQLAELIARFKRQAGMVLMMVSPAMAVAMLATADEKSNRRIIPAWVAKLHRIMDEGRYLLTHQGIAFDSNGTLRDGQHRLSAIIKYGQSVQLFVCFGLAPEAFDAIDLGAKRKAAQMLSINGIPSGSHVAAAVRMMHRIETLGEAIDEHGLGLKAVDIWRQSSILQDALHATHRLHGKCPSSSSAIVAYYEIASKSEHNHRLEEFWDKFCRGHLLDEHDPILLLRRQFETVHRPEGMGGMGQYLWQTTYSAWIIVAWNAWVHRRRRVVWKWSEPHKLPPVDAKAPRGEQA
jgi:hypothetical protein